MESKKTCPECNGNKIIVGNCECNPEWRSMDPQDGVDDCICEPDHDCPTCKGIGYVH